MPNKGRIEGIYVFRLKEGDDLLDEVLRIAEEEGIGSGILMAIGRLSSARFGFYLGAEEGYKVEEVRVPIELLSCTGNIALKDGEPTIHAHLVLGDEGGQIYGGHLMEGCSVSPTVELHIIEIGGLSLTRHFDAGTGLTLLSAKSLRE